MKTGEGEAEKLAAELDRLDSQLAEVRAQARRFAVDRVETGKKLAELGRNFERLSANLAKDGGRKKA